MKQAIFTLSLEILSLLLRALFLFLNAWQSLFSQAQLRANLSGIGTTEKKQENKDKLFIGARKWIIKRSAMY